MMGGRCRPGQFMDGLIRQCVNCSGVCQQPPVNAQCISYCGIRISVAPGCSHTLCLSALESASCNALPGHYYDQLVKKCVRCAEVCGRHPVECSLHCESEDRAFTTIIFPPPPPPPASTKKPLVATTTTPLLNSGGRLVPSALEDSIVLYSLLALCTVLLLSSLSLALAVYLRKQPTKGSKPGPKGANHSQDSVVRPGQEAGKPEQSPRDFVTSITNPSCFSDREPSEDCSPTETCVCVHCFPDLKTLGHSSDRLPRAPTPIYPQAALHRAQMQKAWPLWAEENLHTSSGLQEEAAVG
ncbi:hypothetical protein L3Q82_010529 [Scortum barcoo]|uniref:Uncharacterized protein n=1 Tax=Scortum barcoo TaxID=214431 RepID=A0ACB8WDB4_9TELE|nr:hypothetical protein L3Q82_010529 [Scortum barcoo]